MFVKIIFSITSLAISFVILILLSIFPYQPPLSKAELTSIHVQNTVQNSALDKLKADALFDIHPDGSVTFSKNAKNIVMDSCLCIAGIPIESLEGAPQIIKGGISLSGTSITSLKGLPKQINGGVVLNVITLKSLEGMPERIGGSLILGSNIALEINKEGISTLEYLPKIIEGDLILGGLPITSLKGISESVNGNLNLSLTKVEDLSLLPKKIGKNLILSHMPAKNIPAGLSIGCAIVLDTKNQSELAKDALTKGYRVGDNPGRLGLPRECWL